MANIGRFFCVALPFILTLLSLITLLVACLGGVTNKSLYMFQVNMTDFQVHPSSIKSLIDRDILDDIQDTVDDVVNGDVDIPESVNDITGGSDGGSNVTAADLGLADIYEVNLWGYCTTDLDSGDKECLKPKFDWAAEALNTTILEKFSAVSGKKIDIPEEVTKALDAFSTVTKWTEVAYIAALVSLGVQLVLGIFAQCSRALSCVVFIVAGIAAVAVMGAAALSTAMSVVVVGTVESTARFYGVQGAFNTAFLALVWTSCAFALAAAFFWLFTICCCAPNHTKRRSTRESIDNEKLLPKGAYQPLSEPEMHGGIGGVNRNSYYSSQYGAPTYPSGVQGPRSDLAYEPYSHR